MLRINERKKEGRAPEFSVNFGSVLYNDRIITPPVLILAFENAGVFGETEIGVYAVVNVYYDPIGEEFVLDTVLKSPAPTSFISSDALPNLLPVGQFILNRTSTGIQAEKVYPYSHSSTFSITQIFTEGEKGNQGYTGMDGARGETGIPGENGEAGTKGLTGPRGETGIGMQGVTGPRGEPAQQPDLDLLLYLKFRTDCDLQTDYSVYGRDFTWYSRLTGSEFLDPLKSYREDAVRSVEEGIVDNCHAVEFKGKQTAYLNPEYIDFNGTVQAWVNLNPVPYVEISHEASVDDPLVVTFRDRSLFDPVEWKWEILGKEYNSDTVRIKFPESGMYALAVTVGNRAGVSTQYFTVEV